MVETEIMISAQNGIAKLSLYGLVLRWERSIIFLVAKAFPVVSDH